MDDELARIPDSTSTASFDLSGRVALVTGSSRGVGFALARALGQAGAELILNARDQGALLAAAAELRKEGLTVHCRAFDVCDPVAVVDAVDSFERDVGPIDVLINNAGLQHRAPFGDEGTRQDRQHLFGAIRTRPTDDRALHSDEGWFETAHARDVPDLGPLGIQVNALAPGYFATELISALVADVEFSRWVAQRTPTGRWGRVEELGGAVVFPSSDASSFVNGQVLYVDGGMIAVV